MTDTATQPTQADLAEEWLKRHSGRHSITEIAEGIGLEYQTAAALMSTMVKHGRAARVDQGVYQTITKANGTVKRARKAAKATGKRTAAIRTRTREEERGAVASTPAPSMMVRMYEVVGEQPMGLVVRDPEGRMFLNVPVHMTVDLGNGMVDLGTL